MVHRGHVAKDTRLSEGNGTAVTDPETKAQMDEKHPKRYHPYETAPGRPEEIGPVNLDHAQQVLKQAKPIVGVGPRSLRPGHLAPVS